MKFLLAAVLVAVASSEPGPTRVGTIDFFGTAGIDLAAVRRGLPLHVGDTVPDTEFDRLGSTIRATVIQLTRRRPTDINATCCSNGGDLLVYIGLGGTNSRTFPHRDAPTGAVCLPQTAVDLYDGMVAATMKAVERGDTAEDDSRGYALAHNPDLHQRQLDMRQFATGNIALVEAALRDCRDTNHRRAAAALLGYADRLPQQLAELVRAAHDADGTVRNNAVRALSVIASVDAHAVQTIPVDDLIDLLNSGQWTDRNKAGWLFTSLTESRDPKLLSALADRAFESLVEMARWQDARHAMEYRIILGRIAGIDEARLKTLATAGSADEIIAAAAMRVKVRQR